MKILYIVTQADAGGAQKYVLNLAKHFQGEIASGTEHLELFDNAKKIKIPTHELKYLKRSASFWYDFLAFWELVFLIRKVNPDIVHLNSSKAGFLGSLTKPFHSAKIIFTAHGFVYNEPTSWIKKHIYITLEKLASFFRDYIITVSEADRNSALKYKIISKNKVSTIHNGIEQINFLDKNPAKKFLNINSGKIIIGSIANFYKTKGLDVFIEAVNKLDPDTKSKIEIILIGEGPERQQLEKLINSFKLQNTIQLLGEIKNANQYLKAFDIFILPSRKEGFPYTLLEAIQAGLPILATNVGGNPEAVANTALVVPPNNPLAFAEKLTNLVKNSDLQKDLSKKAFDRSKMFEENKMFLETEKIYKQLT